MQKIIGMVLSVIGASGFAIGGQAPEIDPASAGSALALVSGALLVYKGRRK